MSLEIPTLKGRHIRLEPLSLNHIPGLVAAATFDTSIYRWSPVPQNEAAAATYVKTALAWNEAETCVPFAIVRYEDSTILGSTRFFDVERWAWPAGNPHRGRTTPDVCEIGYTWLARTATRTAANTEAKFLMLSYAFEQWHVHRVCLHTDVRNERSRSAIERIGGQLEGILRAHRMSADFIPRDSARYSIIASEWPEVKKRLMSMLERTTS